MTSRTVKMTMAAMAVATMAGVAPAAALQDGGVGMIATAPAATERARQLRAEAEALYTQPRQWRKAARLLEQSAQLRGADDPEAYSCWMYAARLRASIGDYAGARLGLEKAAAHALARGAVIDAAHAYIDAAHVALQERQPQRAQQLVEQARLLASSPLLDADQADQIVARLRG
jgi:hypothetical protein